MQITKSQLKGLIKECLVEILAEGLGGSLTETVQRTAPSAKGLKRPAGSAPQRPAFNPSLDTPIASAQKRMENAKTGNALIDSMLLETATKFDSIMTQDPSVYGTEGSSQMGPADQTSGLAPDQLFGEGMMSNWLTVLDRIEK